MDTADTKLMIGNMSWVWSNIPFSTHVGGRWMMEDSKENGTRLYLKISKISKEFSCYSNVWDTFPVSKKLVFISSSEKVTPLLGNPDIISVL